MSIFVLVLNIIYKISQEVKNCKKNTDSLGKSNIEKNLMKQNSIQFCRLSMLAAIQWYQLFKCKSSNNILSD